MKMMMRMKAVLPVRRPDGRIGGPTTRADPYQLLPAMASLGLEMERGMLAKEEKKEEDEEEEEGGEASVTDEEEEEESDTEPERPPDAPRKVSFADAFGLDLVSVKEFDDFVVDPSGPGVDGRAEAAAEVTAPHARPRGQAAVENHLSCLFSVPAEPDELRRRLRRQKVELESVELLPGTATLRGVVRVANLCYRKAVYVRVSPDAWRSHFELPAVYVPGSSDRETDRFAFLYVLEPPPPPPAGTAGKTCTRLEFCLRYETEVGTFWANNGGLNFVLFCHRRGRGEEATRDAEPRESGEEEEEEEEEEDHLHRRRLRRSSKQQKGDQRSCLKANRTPRVWCHSRSEKEKGEKEEEEVVVVVDMEEEEEEEEQGKAGSQCTTQKQGTDMQERRYRGHGTR
ncbi:hypothetical protein CRUP_022992 [Coryphaenoides rupestris]|nr:hypothetical protein CRUP_022992 [Coryphaenoides rupestris]